MRNKEKRKPKEENSMANGTQPEKKSVLKELTELGKSKGQLSNKEILDAIGEMDIDAEQTVSK